MSKEEQERNNQEDINNKPKKPRGFRWADLVSTIIGCFLGLILIDFTDIRALLSNVFISTIVSVLIVTAVILIVKFIAYAIARAIRK